MMKLNLPRRLRIWLYAGTLLGSPVVAYLNGRGWIGQAEVTLWSAEVAVVMGLVLRNVIASDQPDQPDQPEPAEGDR